jgi:hypothetical protein
MTELTFEMLHAELAPIKVDITALRAELAPIKADIIGLRHDMVRLEAKIDSKPSSLAMFTGIFVTVFGMAGVIASTIAVLHTLGF